jgi:hypothetical protein
VGHSVVFLEEGHLVVFLEVGYLVVFLEEGHLVVFYYLLTTDIWPDKRGGLW